VANTKTSDLAKNHPLPFYTRARLTLMDMSPFPPATKPPPAVPILLAVTAGFVDSCTFLGLAGFFVAQVTGSYVLVGAQPTAGWPGAVAVLAAPAFFAGGVAATLAAIAGHAIARRPLAAALMLETLLLAAFAAVFAARPQAGAPAIPVAAALCGLAAMGVQSAAVRLLMRGTASTNVMTTATSQLAIEATQVASAWLGLRDGSPETARQVGESLQRLRNGVPLPLAFLFGTLIGAVGFAQVGAPVLAAAVAVVGALAGWAVRWERSNPARE
jgi:uncharacterized membrane protein YoaK (UPF0700 family)